MKFSIINGSKDLLTYKDKNLIENTNTFSKIKDQDKYVKIFPLNENLNLVYVKEQEYKEVVSIGKSLVINLLLDNGDTRSIFLTYLKNKQIDFGLYLFCCSKYHFYFFNSNYFFRSYISEEIEFYCLDYKSYNSYFDPITYIFFKKENWVLKLNKISFIGVTNNILVLSDYSKLYLIDFQKLKTDFTINIVDEFQLLETNLLFFSTLYNKHFNSKEVLLNDLEQSGFYYKYLNYITKTITQNSNKTTTLVTSTPNYKGITVTNWGEVIVSPEADGSKQEEYYDGIKIDGKLIGYPDISVEYECTDLAPHPFFVGDMKFFTTLSYVDVRSTLHYLTGSGVWMGYSSVTVDPWNGVTFRKSLNIETIELGFLNRSFAPINHGDIINKIGPVTQCDFISTSGVGPVQKPLNYLKSIWSGRYPEEGYIYFNDGSMNYRFYVEWWFTTGALTGTKANINYNHRFKLTSKFNNTSYEFYMEFQNKNKNVFKYPLRIKELIPEISPLEQYKPFFSNLYGDRQYGSIISPVFRIRNKWGVYQLSTVDFYLKEFAYDIKTKGTCEYNLMIKDKSIKKEIYNYSDYSYTVHPFISPNYFIKKYICDLSLRISDTPLEVLCFQTNDDDFYLQLETPKGNLEFNLKSLTDLLQSNKIIQPSQKVKEIVSVDYYDNMLHYINKKDLKILKNIIKLI